MLGHLLLGIVLIVGVILIGMCEILTQIIWKIQDIWGEIQGKCRIFNKTEHPGFCRYK